MHITSSTTAMLSPVKCLAVQHAMIARFLSIRSKNSGTDEKSAWLINDSSVTFSRVDTKNL